VNNTPILTEKECLKALGHLTIYAQRRFARLGWWHNGIFESPRGHKPEEIAAEAIVKMIEGTRTYDAQKCPDILQFLRGIVKSDISHIIDSFDFKHRETNEGKIEEKEPQGRNVDPLQLCIEKEQIIIGKKTVKQVEAVLNKYFYEDKIVIGIYECYKAGIYKRSELAEYLEVDVKEIDNAQKRLRREMDKHFRKEILEEE
jgi:DNA-directed RNA polymerase specialized sigma24 family protein